MPATEETYRSQPTLHVVFAITSVAMTLSIVWMIMADHLRPWKQVQRAFQRIETAKLKVVEQTKLAEQKTRYESQIAAIDAKIRRAEENRGANASALRTVDAEIRKLGGRFEELDAKKRFMKADLDSQRSLYDGLIDLGETRAAGVYLNTTIVATERALHTLSLDHEEADRALKKAKARREDLLGNVDELKKDREALTRAADRVRRALAQKEAQYFGLLAWLRGLPGVDMVPPTKIQQISLPDLTINYNFKDVPRYDRCTTCHQGIDRLGYDKDASGGKMPSVFASHPHLADGASTLDLKGNPIPAGLYLDANGPHPINSFGCTICHGGQGSGTDFTYASHEPNDPEEKERWETSHAWREIHHWDEPMLPRRFLESSCLKCHHQVTDVPRAEKLQAGYQRIVKYGCTGCHTIGGEGSFGPDLTDERQVGPNLAHLGSKVSKEWVLKWIKNPHAFRPDSRMPRFYGVTNNNARKDWPKNHAEIHALTHYLFAKSTPPPEFAEVKAKGDPERGKELFFQKGCMACHAHKPYEPADVQLADRDDVNPDYKPDRARTFEPAGFPESVRAYARANFGPNLSNVAAKFPTRDQGYQWLANWIKAPESYHPKSLMPNLQLSAEDAADIAAWVVSVPAAWPVAVDVPAVDAPEVASALDELVALYVAKGGFALGDRHEAVPLSEVEEFVKSKLSRDDKLMFLGEKTISRLGCFGCHNIPGFENAKPIGTPLNGWGIKSPSKLDYGHIAEYLDDQPAADAGVRDGTDAYYREKLHEHTRSGFLFQKLHRPRSYDYKKTSEDVKAWDERLRMPQFAWANDPKAVEEVMTFVLGLTGEKIAARYLPKSHASARRTAVAHGAKLLNRYNCAGCHVLRMPQYVVAPGTALSEAFVGLPQSIQSAYGNRAGDYLKEFYPKLTFDPKTPLDATLAKTLGLTPDDGKGATIEGMPTDLNENELTVQLWRPVTIRGFTFNVGDNVTLDQTKVTAIPAEGGDFAWLYSTAESARLGRDFRDFWNRLPPPLLREGKKVQTPWLTAFLKDPYPIRPAANLRMPRFHFKTVDGSPADETAGLANYFAARDGAEFPYQAIPEKTRSYLSDRGAQHPDYLQAGWSMMAGKGSPCLSCHAIGAFKPTGGEKVVNGPDLRQVGARFQPGYLEEWLARPTRLVPYTAMPQNVPPRDKPGVPVPKSFEDKPLDMVKAIRDTLLNYLDAVERQLAGSRPDGGSEPSASRAGGASE